LPIADRGIHLAIADRDTVTFGWGNGSLPQCFNQECRVAAIGNGSMNAPIGNPAIGNGRVLAN
jgi:hypothetical protein